jgi:hypothetical protein
MRALPVLILSLASSLPVVSQAQGFQTGQQVYATPSGATNDWYSGCVVQDGRSNSSYQVKCAGTTYWITAANISVTAPQPRPDPMRPGQMSIPRVTASAAPPPVATIAPPASAPPAAAVVPRPGDPVTASDGPGHYADGMAKRIEADHVAAANAVLRPGKYSCYSMGQYTFTDLYITGAHSYAVKPGGSGDFNYAKGALTFLSGPYAGAYARMVDGKTVGISAKGNTNLGTQCGFEG